MTEVLLLECVSLVRDEKRILRDIDWVVDRGEFWVVIGPNGAGKSSLLSLCAGRAFPSTGNAYVLGKRLGSTDVRVLRRQIAHASGAVGRELPNASEATALVATGASGVLADWWDDPSPITRQTARQLLGDLGASHVIGRTFGHLSDGERQKVVLARALQAASDLSLFDECFAGLDTAAREKLVVRLDELAKSTDRTAVVVTHHLEEIPQRATHALLMKDGAVETSGAIVDVVNSASLSELFEMSLKVERIGGRWTCRADPAD